MQFKTPRILAKVLTDDWAITPGVLNSILDRVSALRDTDRVETRIMGGEMERKKPKVNVANGIAVVPMAGIVGKRLSDMEMMCGGMDLDEQISAIEEASKDNGAVIMQFDSPGGTVTGVPEAYDKLRQIGKKTTLLAYTDTIMASAAHWLASAASSIYASRSATVGSIGVYNVSLDYSRQLDEAGIKVNAIHAGDLKLMGAPFKKMTDEERAYIQNRVDEIHTEFKSAVSKGRKIDRDKMFRGQTFTGKEALNGGLLDGLHDSIGDLIAYLTT
jgi:signal peptide peptidase SppA